MKNFLGWLSREKADEKSQPVERMHEQGDANSGALTLSFGISPPSDHLTLDLLLSRFLYGRSISSPEPPEWLDAWRDGLGCELSEAVARLREQGLIQPANNTTKIKMWRVAELKQRLRDRGLKVSGKKDELVERLLKATDDNLLAELEANDAWECSPSGREMAESSLEKQRLERGENEPPKQASPPEGKGADLTDIAASRGQEAINFLQDGETVVSGPKDSSAGTLSPDEFSWVKTVDGRMEYRYLVPEIEMIDGLSYFDPKIAERVALLKREKRHNEAIELLCRVLNATERGREPSKEFCVAPWAYGQLAIIYRKEKRHADEVAILERFSAFGHFPGEMPPKLLRRLGVARALLEKQKQSS